MIIQVRRWATILVVFASFAVGVFFGITTKSFLGFVFVFATGIFMSFLFIIVPLLTITAAIDQHDTTGKIIDVIISQVQKHPEIGLWPTGIAAVIFFGLSTVWITLIYQGVAEVTIELMQSTVFYEVGSFFVMIVGLVVVLLSRIRRAPRLSSALADKITYELISETPQAAIEYAFTFFEDYLRNRIEVTPEIHGEILVNQAFGEKNGKLKYGETESERKGMRNLMSGAYATFRNPRKHRIVLDDTQTVFAIITLVDLLIQLIDKSEDALQVT